MKLTPFIVLAVCNVVAVAAFPLILPAIVLLNVFTPAIVCAEVVFTASVIPYPARVVGFVPAVTCPAVSTVTLLYVPAGTQEFGWVYVVLSSVSHVTVPSALIILILAPTAHVPVTLFCLLFHVVMLVEVIP